LKSAPELQDFTFNSKLGTGSYSEVWKVTRKSDSG
jgi:NIMA (never in mitosis gene a)-related kinase 1/4/5